MTNDVAVVILAAGQGTRMKSRMAKVLHRAGGKPLVRQAIDTALAIAPPERIFVVVGYQADQVRAEVEAAGVQAIHQTEQLGTGHAARMCVSQLEGHKTDVFMAMRPLGSDDILRGQYQGYRDEPQVANDSDVETFCALRLHIDSWRWAGVPWYLRSGKCLPVSACEVVVTLKAPPQNLFGDAATQGETNHLRLRLSPHSAIALTVRVKRPGKEFIGDRREFLLLEEQHSEQSPYERLLIDAMNGDGALFSRESAIEAAWAAVEPVLFEHPAVIPYAPGSWGPAAANHFIAADGGWSNPEYN